MKVIPFRRYIARIIDRTELKKFSYIKKVTEARIRHSRVQVADMFRADSKI